MHHQGSGEGTDEDMNPEQQHAEAQLGGGRLERERLREDTEQSRFSSAKGAPAPAESTTSTTVGTAFSRLRSIISQVKGHTIDVSLFY